MICPQCQKANEPDSAFCGNCGQALRDPVTVPGSPGAGPPERGSAVSARPRGEVFHLDLRRLGRTEQVVGGAGLVLLISLFLPWYGFSALGASVSLSGVTAHGYLYLVLILTLAILAYLVLRAGWDQPPVSLPVAHGPLLLAGTGLQFLLVLIAFLDKPIPELSWDIGAYLALIAAIAAAAPVIAPAIRAWQASR